ncbi:Alpha-2-macroglobulin-like protein 1 [Oryzias melastigma]|uniref:Alpha-2-macroglobulin-like protein 1 n=1 Tax=Oryzias melastigma TaxID=30732 RepID=A0A834FIM9_ORYME|nr:Alpha-2-macroglobulin-like protein 1 [Oryzias melastigma]
MKVSSIPAAEDSGSCGPADMTPHLLLGAIVAASLTHFVAPANLNETIYFVTVGSRLMAGNQETLCALIQNPTEPITLNVSLDLDSSSVMITEEPVQSDYYRCFQFLVPIVSMETVASISVRIQGEEDSMSQDTKVLIEPPAFIHIVQTDKPIYKPGQTVQFRIVSMDTSFLPVNRTVCYVMCLLFQNQDPNSNRIAQWLDKSIDGGILDLSHPTIPEAAQGIYTITAETDKGEAISYNFEIKEYVLPKFEVTVNLPNVITILDKEATMKICGKYTYGKPVLGSVKAEFCRRAYPFNWWSPTELKDICVTFKLTTDKSGCATQTVDLADFALDQNGFEDNFEVTADLEEFGTGVILKASGSARFTTQIRGVSFEEVPSSFKPGLPFEGKIKVVGADDSPIAKETVYLYIEDSLKFTLKTDRKGFADFSLDTSSWSESVYLLATTKIRDTNATQTDFQVRLPYYGEANYYVARFYSKSKSFVEFDHGSMDLPCDKDGSLIARYIIQGEDVQKGQKVLNFFYMVESKGSVVQQGTISVRVKDRTVNKGKLKIPLTKVMDLAPVAQVVVYTMLSSGEVVADSRDFPIQLCLNNKVSLKFSALQELPGAKTTLTLQAQPSSLCSVRAIDQSVLLLKSEEELTTDYVYGQLPIQRMWGYDYRVDDYFSKPCFPDPWLRPVPLPVEPELIPRGRRDKRSIILPAYGGVDVYTIFKAEGVPQMFSYNALLCPADGPVSKNISLELPEEFVTGSERASVSVLGQYDITEWREPEPVYGSLTSLLGFTGDLMGRAMKNLDKLLAMPYGCGEQNMLLFAPNIFILDYLKSTGQLKDSTLKTAVGYLESGYQRELNYKHDDGSYSAFGMSDPSGNTWLTAFVMKSFNAAKKYIFVDPRNIEDARTWLSGLQKPNGCIQSVGKLFHNGMKGGVSDDVSLTAYVAAAMLELDGNATDPVVQNCLKCLETAQPDNITNLYTVALMSYTFTLAGDEDMRSKLITQLDQQSTNEGGSIHWKRDGASETDLDSVEVEMTSYVLLALLSGPSLPDFGLDYAAGIVRWLAQQQNPFGGFSSTQDTVVALQALAKYASATYSPEGSTTVTVTSAGGLNKHFTVNKENRLLYQEEKLSEIPGEYTIKAEGQSCVLAQISLFYNIPPPSDFSAFQISTNTSGRCDLPRPEFMLFVHVKFQGRREETNMVVINIKLLSGYILQDDSLKMLKENRLVKRVDVEEGFINIYLDELQNGQEETLDVTLEEDQPVQNLKPAVVKVYDYYQTSDQAVTDYNSPCKK